ncbi:TrbG/VirB9 family P-type conjugative transfer protein [Novosphingobium piscinae]|uniref:TrbG/VirB9 family P-type conjugative transfer protein n=1 Tax=Novosphingobium piscinae TaxID=1507448 RepID=A0A7X1KQZ0_9SPHN|nr:TrbG/VirB9 family P-type conjugative transfer protein [Novosphingobium piscinae]MBC2670197.1 TrbG/VirB9 family P-type conjugative transfer protein [Novosphingobium piscinae]
MRPFTAPGWTLAALAALTATVAQAREEHVTTRTYVADRVERFVGRPGFQSTIAFAPAERIENIAVGDGSGWQITPNRAANLLFVKPTGSSARLTNMTVVTDRRTYLFELRNDPRAVPAYLIRFSYPAAEAEPSPAPAPAVIAAAETVVAPSALPLDRMNFGWTMRGEKRLFPDRVFDDGEAVYLAWSPDRALPAILAPAPDGRSEGPVNFTARGQFLVVEGRHARLVLRSGRDMAVLEGAAAPGEPPATPARVAAAR